MLALYAGLQQPASAQALGLGFPCSVSIPDLHPESDAGLADDDNITKDVTPRFTGTAGLFCTSVTLFKGGTQLGTDSDLSVVGGQKVYDITSECCLPAGDSAIHAQGTGGTTNPASGSITITIDITNPSRPETPPVLDPASDTGEFNSDGLTQDRTLNLSGLAGGDAVQVEVVDTSSGIGTVTLVSGAWAFTTLNSGAGRHAFSARAIDLAGNKSGNSPPLLVTIGEQRHLVEAFEGEQPAGWVFEQDAGIPPWEGSWQIEMDPAWIDGSAALGQAAGTELEDFVVSLQLPPQDFSDAARVHFSFLSEPDLHGCVAPFEDGAYYHVFRVELSLDGGASWQIPEQGGGGVWLSSRGDRFGYRDLSASVAGPTNPDVRFRFALQFGTQSLPVDLTCNALAWAIDDVLITTDDDIPDEEDNCPYVTNLSQADLDLDGTGDACDAVDGRPTCNGELATIWQDSDGLIVGTSGNDVIVGTAGSDNIKAGGGNDIICGRGANDVIDGGSGLDFIDGGSGSDTASFPGTLGRTISLTKGTVSGEGVGRDLKSIENIKGSNARDVITGSNQPNKLEGNKGDDKFRGGGGPDQLFGGSGVDTLGGQGDAGDKCSGGKGQDEFLGGSKAASGCENVSSIP